MGEVSRMKLLALDGIYRGYDTTLAAPLGLGTSGQPSHSLLGLRPVTQCAKT